MRGKGRTPSWRNARRFSPAGRADHLPPESDPGSAGLRDTGTKIAEFRPVQDKIAGYFHARGRPAGAWATAMKIARFSHMRDRIPAIFIPRWCPEGAWATVNRKGPAGDLALHRDSVQFSGVLGEDAPAIRLGHRREV